jgi:hypothetical protein
MQGMITLPKTEVFQGIGYSQNYIVEQFCSSERELLVNYLLDPTEVLSVYFYVDEQCLTPLPVDPGPVALPLYRDSTIIPVPYNARGVRFYLGEITWAVVGVYDCTRFTGSLQALRFGSFPTTYTSKDVRRKA